MENKETDLLTLKRNAILLGLCDQYRGKWDACKSKRELVDLALDSNGVEFMADSMAFGWGLGKDYLLREFGEWMNGFYISREGGYTSEMYVGAHGVLNTRSALLLVAYCGGLEIIVPEHHVCRIYVCGGSKARIECLGDAEVVEYGVDNDVCIVEHDGARLQHHKVTSSGWTKKDI